MSDKVSKATMKAMKRGMESINEGKLYDFE